jgi:hypothetical protein
MISWAQNQKTQTIPIITSSGPATRGAAESDEVILCDLAEWRYHQIGHTLGTRLLGTSTVTLQIALTGRRR